jgi:hypothetical protein
MDTNNYSEVELPAAAQESLQPLSDQDLAMYFGGGAPVHYNCC